MGGLHGSLEWRRKQHGGIVMAFLKVTRVGGTEVWVNTKQIHYFHGHTTSINGVEVKCTRIVLGPGEFLEVQVGNPAELGKLFHHVEFPEEASMVASA